MLGHRNGKGIAVLVGVSSNGKANLAERDYSKNSSRISIALLVATVEFYSQLLHDLTTKPALFAPAFALNKTHLLPERSYSPCRRLHDSRCDLAQSVQSAQSTPLCAARSVKEIVSCFWGKF
jgi:hypothetical protein